MHVRMTRTCAGPSPVDSTRLARLLRAAPLGVALGALIAAGCTIQVNPRNQPPPAAPTTMTVKLVNKTGKPLDPQIYVGRVANGRDLLFSPVNQRKDFGFAMTGLLDVNDTAQFDVECGVPVYIGTAGGIYGDNLADPAGQGQPKILEEGASINCGDTATFTYSVSRGALLTTVQVAPAQP